MLNDHMVLKKMYLAIVILMLIPLHSYALIVTSPENGSSFKEGDTVALEAELTPDDPDWIESVHFVVSGLPNVCLGDIKTHPRYRCTFVLPPGCPKSITILAYAVTSSGVVDAKEITVSVVLPSSLTLLSIKSDTGNKIFITALADSEQLDIIDVYSDGVERDISLRQAGTTYISSNEKVVNVNADGLITAVGMGTAQITVRNRDKQLVLNAIVKLK